MKVHWIIGDRAKAWGSDRIAIGRGEGFEVHVGRTDAGRLWASIETEGDIGGVLLGTFASMSDVRRRVAGSRRAGSWRICGGCGAPYADRHECR